MQSTSDSIQGFSAALCAVSNPAAQLTSLFENSVRHTRFHLSVQFGIRCHFKNCTASVLAGLWRGRKGAREAPWVWRALSSLWQPRFSLAVYVHVHEVQCWWVWATQDSRHRKQGPQVWTKDGDHYDRLQCEVKLRGLGRVEQSQGRNPEWRKHSFSCL